MSERSDILLKKFRAQEDVIEERLHHTIENDRKTKAVVQIVDGAGKPVSGAKVRVTLRDHDFKYGANLFMLDEFECEEKNAIYRGTFHNVFNLATLPFYWSDLEPEKGRPRFAKDSPKIYRRPAPDLCLEYCEENGITPQSVKSTVQALIRITDSMAAGAPDTMSEEELTALMKSVEDQMLSAAKELDFEKAAKLRDQLFQLKGEKQDIQKPQQRRHRKKKF